MTDNEIIKALECHMSKSLDDCEKCPLYAQKNVFYSCRRDLCESSLDLINRQKEEIKELRENQDTLTTILAQSFAVKLCGGNPVAEIKAKAIKEFAELVYKRLISNWGCLKSAWLFNDECYWLRITFDDLVKEMVGEDK